METESKAKRKRLLRDLLLISSFLIVGLLLFLVLTLTKEEGGAVVVEIDGETVATYPLDRDGEYSLNGGTNILIIKEGVAFLREADCPDKTCVRRGKIRYSGESIICLPNRLTVTVVGGEEGVDFVS